jgi:hypothetical protein
MSRDELAGRIGMARGTSLSRYENVEYWRGRKFPAAFVARLARALVGKGEPPISAQECWRLSESQSGVIVTSDAIVVIPLHRWEGLKMGVLALLKSDSDSSVEVAGLPGGDYLALTLSGGAGGAWAPDGCILIVATSDTLLIDGGRYVIIYDHGASLRRYRQNPSRFESPCPGVETIFQTGPLEIVGRAIRVISDWT